MQHGTTTVAVSAVARQVFNGKGGGVIALVGTGHIEVLVGGSVEVGLVERHACAEDNARDALHRGVELPLTGFLPIQVIDGTMQGGGEHGFDVNLHTGLIVLQDGSITCTALHLDGLGGVDDDA